jgi:hypothetical protein
MSEYEYLFDKKEIDLLKEKGGYSAYNKGNNSNGVSKDHMYSITKGFENNIETFIIKHPANCQLMLHKDNMVKNVKCSIDLQELYKKVLRVENIKQVLSEEQLQVIKNKIL